MHLAAGRLGIGIILDKWLTTVMMKYFAHEGRQDSDKINRNHGRLGMGSRDRRSLGLFFKDLNSGSRENSLTPPLSVSYQKH